MLCFLLYIIHVTTLLLYYRGVMDLQAVISCQPIIGPALLVNGKLLTWDGPPLPAVPERLPQTPSRATQSESVLNVARSQDSTRSLREVDAKRVTVHRNPIGFRVCLESETGVRVTSHVELENCGTAAVYYSWQVSPELCLYAVYHCTYLLHSPFPNPIHLELFRLERPSDSTLTPKEVNVAYLSIRTTFQHRTSIFFRCIAARTEVGVSFHLQIPQRWSIHRDLAVPDWPSAL